MDYSNITQKLKKEIATFLGEEIEIVSLELTDKMLDLACSLALERSRLSKKTGNTSEYAIGYAMIMLGLIRGKHSLETMNKKHPEDLINLGRLFVS